MYFNPCISPAAPSPVTPLDNHLFDYMQDLKMVSFSPTKHVATSFFMIECHAELSHALGTDDRFLLSAQRVSTFLHNNSVNIF